MHRQRTSVMAVSRGWGQAAASGAAATCSYSPTVPVANSKGEGQVPAPHRSHLLRCSYQAPCRQPAQTLRASLSPSLTCSQALPRVCIRLMVVLGAGVYMLQAVFLPWAVNRWRFRHIPGALQLEPRPLPPSVPAVAGTVSLAQEPKARDSH